MTTNKQQAASTQQVLTEKQELARARRKALKDLCNKLQQVAKAMGVEMKPNELLRQHYAQAGHTELKSFSEWKEAGYYVKKGEKAILLWAHPKPSREAKELAKSEGKNEDEAKNDFYPLAYLFSSKQVAKIQ